MTSNTWELIHAERRRLIEDLEPLTAEQWRTASLCPKWNAQQALGHIVATTKMTPPKFFGKIIASGFQFEKMAAKDVATESSGTPAQTLAELAAHAEDTHAPPGPVVSWLGEIIVHGADIRRPLGVAYSPQPATTRLVADFYKNSNLLIGSKNRIAGVRLVATDVDWSNGTGPEASGPILSLVQAMTGRAVALGDLSGDGVPTLKAKMPTG